MKTDMTKPVLKKYSSRSHVLKDIKEDREEALTMFQARNERPK